jgi:hypothetical protein
MAVRTAVLANIADLPVKQIIEFRLKYEAEFDAFTTAVDAAATEIGTDLADISDPVLLTSYLGDEVRRRFSQPTKDIRAAIKSAKWDAVFALTSAKVEVPALVSTVTGAQLGHPVTGTAAGIAVVLLRTRRAARMAVESALRPSAGSYLFRLDDHLTPRGILGQVKRSLAKLGGLA